MDTFNDEVHDDDRQGGVRKLADPLAQFRHRCGHTMRCVRCDRTYLSAQKSKSQYCRDGCSDFICAVPDGPLCSGTMLDEAGISRALHSLQTKNTEARQQADEAVRRSAELEKKGPGVPR